MNCASAVIQLQKLTLNSFFLKSAWMETRRDRTNVRMQPLCSWTWRLLLYIFLMCLSCRSKLVEVNSVQPSIANFGRSLLGGYCSSYVPDFVLQGIGSDEKLRHCLVSDLSHAVQVIKLYLVDVFITVGKGKYFWMYKSAASGNIYCCSSLQVSPVPGHTVYVYVNVTQLMYLKNMVISL